MGILWSKKWRPDDDLMWRYNARNTTNALFPMLDVCNQYEQYKKKAERYLKRHGLDQVIAVDDILTSGRIQTVIEKLPPSKARLFRRRSRIATPHYSRFHESTSEFPIEALLVALNDLHDHDSHHHDHDSHHHHDSSDHHDSGVNHHDH